MLLVALREAEAGRRVCVVDRSEAIGGLWQTVPITAGWEVEYACHLIEEFPGVYEHLEAASGITFRPLDEQPIRVTRSGKILPYSTRATVLLATGWSVGKLILYGVKVAIGQADHGDREQAAIFRQKITNFVRHHKGLVFRGSTLKGPAGGYATFIRSLKARCDVQGIVFRQFEVSTARRAGDHWVVQNEQGEQLSTREIHATTSATLDQTSAYEFSAHEIRQTVTRAILVQIPREQIRSRVSYAAFWKDPKVVRVSRVDEPKERPEGILYLIQLARSAAEADSLNLIRSTLRRCGVIGRTGVVSIVREIECPRIPHDRQLATGLLAPGFRTHSSEGNLASGVARWLSSN